MIARVELGGCVVAYLGPGTVQDFRGAKEHEVDNQWDAPLWVPSPSIPQVYVPLMKKGDPGSSVVEEAFRSAYIVTIDKWDDSYIRATPKEKWRIWG